MDPWPGIAARAEQALNLLMEGGQESDKSRLLGGINNEVYAFLDSIPSLLVASQRRSHELLADETASFLRQVERNRRQAELLLTITKELLGPATIGKLRNLTFSWQLRDKLFRKF
jgi:hypothetical protein